MESTYIDGAVGVERLVEVGVHEEGVSASRSVVVASFWQISAKCCSFSAVSAPIFARKYAFCVDFYNAA